MNYRSEQGYTLVALLIMIAVGSILLASIAPTWGYLVQRDKEEELIFRGESYVFAIKRYQERFNKLPSRLQDLEKDEYFIRKLYDDPVTGTSFELLVFDGANRIRESEMRPTQRRILRGETPGTSSFGIIGVVSTSDQRALRPYKEKEYYNEWEFFDDKSGGEGGEESGQDPSLNGNTSSPER